MTSSRRGLLLALTGIMLLSFDSVLVKLIDSSDWDLLFWRGGLLACSMALYLLLFKRHELAASLESSAPSILLPALAFAAMTVFFIESLSRTQVASTLVILNTAPLFTAILAFMMLHEKIHVSTLVAIAVSISGIWIIFAFEPAKGQLLGNVYAVFAALSAAFYLVFLRKAKGMHLGSILLAAGVLVACYALFRGAQPLAINGQQFLLLLMLGGVLVPGSSFLIGRSTAYIPAAQTSFIQLGEVFLGPLYVFLIIGSKPSDNDIAGAAVILLTLGIYTGWQIKLSRGR